jgi:hypothetical protein
MVDCVAFVLLLYALLGTVCGIVDACDDCRWMQGSFHVWRRDVLPASCELPTECGEESVSIAVGEGEFAVHSAATAATIVDSWGAPVEWLPGVQVSGHFGPVVDVAWGPNGGYLMSCSTDQTVRVVAKLQPSPASG